MFSSMTRVQALVCSVTLTAASALLCSARASADSAGISAGQAIHYVGQVVTVCGRVASARYASESNGQPTFLNLDKAYPNQDFTAVIWGKDRAKFSPPPESFAGRSICVTGTVELYRGKAEIAVTAPSQLTTK
jgi:hypothetical protein